MTDTTIVTQSSIRNWRTCRHAFALKYIDLLRPKKISRPLTFGSAVHKVIEYSLQGKSVADAIKHVNEKRSLVFAAEVDMWDTILQDATIIMDAYFEHWKNEDLEFVEVGKNKAEHQFQTKLAPHIELRGVIDAIARTPDGRVLVVEHKTRGGRIEGDTLKMSDLQVMLYSHVAEKELGVKRVGGVLWDFIRSKSPTVPEPLKDGSLSKRRIDTLPIVYENAIKQHGLDRKHYLDVLQTLDENVRNWFRRVKLPISKVAREQLLDETIITAREIRRKAGTDRTRNVGRHCAWCSYESLCRAELFGHDVDGIIDREYRRDERAHPELADDEAADDE